MTKRLFIRERISQQMLPYFHHVDKFFMHTTMTMTVPEPSLAFRILTCEKNFCHPVSTAPDPPDGSSSFCDGTELEFGEVLLKSLNIVDWSFRKIISEANHTTKDETATTVEEPYT